MLQLKIIKENSTLGIYLEPITAFWQSKSINFQYELRNEKLRDIICSRNHKSPRKTLQNNQSQKCSSTSTFFIYLFLDKETNKPIHSIRMKTIYLLLLLSYVPFTLTASVAFKFSQ